MENNDIVQSPQIEAPQYMISGMRAARFGNILSKICYVSASLLGIAALSMVVAPLMQIFLVIMLLLAMLCMIVFTAGMVFTLESKPVAKVWDIFQDVLNSEAAVDIVKICTQMIPYFCFIGIVSSVLGIVILSVNKYQRSVGKIVALSILLAVFIIALIVYFVLGGTL